MKMHNWKSELGRASAGAPREICGWIRLFAAMGLRGSELQQLAAGSDGQTYHAGLRVQLPAAYNRADLAEMCRAATKMGFDIG